MTIVGATIAISHKALQVAMAKVKELTGGESGILQPPALEFFVVDLAGRQMRALRKRSELAITETELKLMAAAAMIGDSSRPKNG